jgi:hypothetical protein
MTHECPVCGEDCGCDMEYDQCSHECKAETYEDDEELDV